MGPDMYALTFLWLYRSHGNDQFKSRVNQSCKLDPFGAVWFYIRMALNICICFISLWLVYIEWAYINELCQQLAYKSIINMIIV